MLHKKLKTIAFIAFLLILSSIPIQSVYGQQCPGLGVPSEELCLVMDEWPRHTGGPIGPHFEQRGQTQIIINQSFGDHTVNLQFDLVLGPQIAITVQGWVRRDSPGDNHINIRVQGGLAPAPLEGGGSLRLEGNATGASVINLGAGAGYDIGVGEPSYFPFPRMITQTNPGPAVFDIIEDEQPLPQWGEWVAITMVLTVDITNVGDTVDLPGGTGINVDNPGGIDLSCLGVPTNFVNLCEEVEGLASGDTCVYYGDNLVAAGSLFFQVPEAGPVDLTLVPQDADLWGALFRTGEEVCSEYVESRLFPAEVGATENFTLEQGTYFIVIHRDVPGLCVPFTFSVDHGACEGIFEWAGPDFTVDEDAGTAEITVVRRHGSIGAVSVDYATSDDTAEAGTDYNAASGTLNWADGDNSPIIFTIPIIDDTLVEGNETLNLELTNPLGGALLGDLFTAVVTIEDNDEVFTISGQVTDDWGLGLDGVTLTFSNDGGTATTDGYGYYSHSVPSGWSGTVIPTKAGYSFTPPSRDYTDVTANITDQDYTASIIQYTLTIDTTAGGTTDPAPGSYTYDYGTEVSVTAVPNSGYQFSGWSGDATGTTNPITVTMDGDKSITANFSTIQYTLTIAAGAGGTTNPAPGNYTYDTGTQVAVTAVPNDGYQFSHWSGDASGTTNPITITMDADKSITANFHPTQCTLTIEAGPDGTTDPEPGIYTHDYGAEVSVRAIPDGGHNFSHWTGDATGPTNPITITMDADKFIKANFTFIDIEEDIGQGCPMLTTANGTPLQPHLDILRDFRDKYLMPSKFGRSLVDLYYKYSPYVAELIEKNKVLRMMAWINLLPLVAFSYSMVNFGPAVSAVMVVFVFVLPVILISFFRRRLRRKERMIGIIVNYSLTGQGTFQKA